MAGRGRRLGGYGEKDAPLRRPGQAAVSPTTTGNINIAALIGKINCLNIFNVDPILLHETEILFKQLFVTGEAVKEILSNLHDQALKDSGFGEKLMIALDQVLSFELDNVRVRSEWLTHLQQDYKEKETMSRSDSRKFANAVLLLGDSYKMLKVSGKPITALGCALLDYIEYLVQIEDDTQYQVLTTQIILNGDKIITNEDGPKRFELLKHSLRKILITRNLNSKSRCWILLAIDYLSNNMKPLSGVIREFYLENMGDNYLQLEARCHNTAAMKDGKFSPKSQVSPSSKSETESINSNKSEGIFQDIENLNLSNPGHRFRSVTKSHKPEQVKLTPKKQGSELKISATRSKSPKSEDDFYGIQVEKKKGQNKKGEN